MSFFIHHVIGDDEENPDLEELEQLYSEKDDGDEEHFGVSLIHESGWCLGLDPGDTLIWENVEEGHNPRHMKNVSKSKVLELWKKLAEGRSEEIDSEPWRDGYY